MKECVQTTFIDLIEHIPNLNTNKLKRTFIAKAIIAFTCHNDMV